MNPSIPSALSPLDELTVPRQDPPERYRGVDRRRTDSYRLPLQREIVDTELGTVEIQDLSVGGTGLVIGSADPDQISGRSLHIPLGPDAGLSARLEVVRTQWDRGGLRVGTRFVDLDRDSLTQLSRILIPGLLDRSRQLSHIQGEREPLISEGPRTTSRLLKLHGIVDGNPLQVFRGESRLPARVLLQSIASRSGQRQLIGHLVGDGSGLRHDVTYTCVLPAEVGVYYFGGRFTEIVGDRVHLTLPERLCHAGFRDSFRRPVQSSHGAVVSLRHPREERDLPRRSLIDVGARGFSFRIEPQDLLIPGERLARFRMQLPSGEIEGEAMLRSVYPKDGGAVHGGAEILQLADRHDELRWHRFVLEQINPALELLIQDTDARFWRALEATGYVQMWGSDAQRLKASFADTWSNMPRGCGKLVLVNRGGRGVATSAGSLHYPRTWLLQHVGISEGERGVGNRRNFMRTTRDLYRGLLYAMEHVDALDYVLVYGESERGHGDKLCKRFAEQVNDSDQVVCLENTVFRGNSWSQDPPCEPREPLEIADADGEQLRLISRRLRESVQPIQFDALAFSEEEIVLERFSEECSSLGFERQRRVLVACWNGTPTAAMFVELGPEGVNVFGLLNACWFVNLDSDAEMPLVIRRELLRRAKKIYRDAGKRDFILFRTLSSDQEELRSSGVHFVSGGIQWIIRTRMVPIWRSYVDDLFGVHTL